MDTGRWIKCMAVFQALLALANLALLVFQTLGGAAWQSGQTVTLIIHAVLLGSVPGVWRGNIWAVRAASLAVFGELLWWLPLCAFNLYMAFQGAELFKDSPGTLLVVFIFTGAKVLPDFVLFVSYLVFMFRRARQRMQPDRGDVMSDVG